jgi:hypothetical protein
VPAQRQDSLLRLLDEAAASIDRLRGLLDGDGAAPAEILRDIRAAESALLGPHASVLRALDAATALRILGDPRRAARWADLLRLESATHRRAGDDARAAALDSRAEGISATAPL